MAPWLLPNKNKRGDRGIVSRLLGGVGEMLFFASLCLIGVVLSAALVTIQLTISVDGEPYYSYVGFVLRLVAVAALIIVGGYRASLVAWQASCSVERRSAIKDRGMSIEAAHSQEASPFPAIPMDSELTSSAGTRLQYRLPCLESPNRTLLAATIICLCLIGIASVTAVLALESFRAGPRDMLVVGVAIACLAGAVWSVYFLMISLLRFTAIGPTNLEISAHPLYPGQKLTAELTQAGRMNIRRLQIVLTCYEEAIYEQGTNVRTERREVFQSRLFEARNLLVEPESNFSQTVEIEVPFDIMHSFRSASNAISWTLSVKGLAVRWSRFERSFPIVIFPRDPLQPIAISKSEATATTC